MSERADFTLLGLLGGGTSGLRGHPRFSIAVYKAGSILVLWDYLKDRKHMIPPSPWAWSCRQLAFDASGRHLLGFAVNSLNELVVTAWRTRDGHAVCQANISNSAACDDVCIDGPLVSTHETSSGGEGGPDIYVAVQVAAVGFIGVYEWRPPSLQPFVKTQDRQKEGDIHASGDAGFETLAFAHVGSTEDVRAVRFMPFDGQMVTLEPYRLCFYRWQANAIVLLTRLHVKQRLSTFEVHAGTGQLLLLTESGRAVVLSSDGAAITDIEPPTPFSSFASIATGNDSVAFGTHEGSLLLYRRDDWTVQATIPRPSIDGLGILHPHKAFLTVVHMAWGSAQDYLLLTYADGTTAVVHVSSGRYIMYRLTHTGPLFGVASPVSLSLAMPPSPLQERETLIAFVTCSRRDPHIITWPSGGRPPFRTSFPSFNGPPTIDRQSIDPQPLESFSPSLMMRHPPDCPEWVPMGVGRAVATQQVCCVAFRPLVPMMPQGPSLVMVERSGSEGENGDVIGVLQGEGQLYCGCVDGSIYEAQLQTKDTKPTTVGAGKSRTIEADPTGLTSLCPPLPYDWTAVRVRPFPHDDRHTAPSRPEDVTALPSPFPAQQSRRGRPSPCVSLEFSAEGHLLLATYGNGMVDLLRAPQLERAEMIEPPFQQGEERHYKRKAVLVPRATTPDHHRNNRQATSSLSGQGMCVVTAALSSTNKVAREAVLYELYPLGKSLAKYACVVYRLPWRHQQLSELCLHPSGCFLVAIAVRNKQPPSESQPAPEPAAEDTIARSEERHEMAMASPGLDVVVFDLLTGSVLACVDFRPFPLLQMSSPPRPIECVADPTGCYLLVGCILYEPGEYNKGARRLPPEEHHEEGTLGWPFHHTLYPATHPILNRYHHKQPSAAATQPMHEDGGRGLRAVCVLDFSTGLPGPHLLGDFSRISFAAADPSTVLLGHSDGSLSAWQLPSTLLAGQGHVWMDCQEATQKPLPRAHLLEPQKLRDHWRDAIDWDKWGGNARIDHTPIATRVHQPVFGRSPEMTALPPPAADDVERETQERDTLPTHPLFAEARQFPQSEIAIAPGTPLPSPDLLATMEDADGNATAVVRAPELLRRFGDDPADAEDPIPSLTRKRIGHLGVTAEQHSSRPASPFVQVSRPALPSSPHTQVAKGIPMLHGDVPATAAVGVGGKKEGGRVVSPGGGGGGWGEAAVDALRFHVVEETLRDLHEFEQRLAKEDGDGVGGEEYSDSGNGNGKE
ncbi:unnamed protein product [Vitrella brassicaformis CCMP3155]|uniref:Uncharacterized protein n=3 Tax=Vitrella brassicaformis TaxID=1169539 RepID=A0A0G4F4N9_VITBC|nr:unnamed protein product [Vitrella brassicaformis CCMP3155]|eukprot:CEM06685.1 unnamed protein product [Vitrella brassicaformis CCMP3155]